MIMATSLPPAPGRIFISYRREETAYPAGWLYDRLAARFATDQVFKDVDSIELGDDFVEVISGAVGSCDVLLALIGDRWLTITDEDGQRRLDDPNDFVRVEIEAALTRNVRVIPILVEGARMPRATELPPSLARLVRRQALELHPARFDFDTGRLLRVLDKTLAEVRTAERDAALTTAPAEAAPDPSTTELPAAAEQREQPEHTPPPSTPPAPATLAATAPPLDSGKSRQPSPTEVQQAPVQQEQPERTPTPSIPPAPATPTTTRPPAEQTKPPEKQPRRLSTRARVLAGAGIGVVLILVIVAIVARSQTNETVIFEDGFSSQVNGWYDAGSEDAGGHYNNGAYRILAKPDSDGDAQGGQPENASIVYPSAPRNLSIQVEAQRTEGEQDTWYGMTCRAAAESGNPAYVFEIGDGHVHIGKLDASGFHVLKGVDTSTVDANAKNSLEADCTGDEEQTYVYLAFWVNGEKVVEVTDESPLPAGTVGLFVATGANAKTAVAAEFDNFVVKQV
jgi:TIR domain